MDELEELVGDLRFLHDSDRENLIHHFETSSGIGGDEDDEEGRPDLTASPGMPIRRTTRPAGVMSPLRNEAPAANVFDTLDTLVLTLDEDEERLAAQEQDDDDEEQEQDDDDDEERTTIDFSAPPKVDRDVTDAELAAILGDMMGETKTHGLDTKTHGLDKPFSERNLRSLADSVLEGGREAKVHGMDKPFSERNLRSLADSVLESGADAPISVDDAAATLDLVDSIAAPSAGTSLSAQEDAFLLAGTISTGERRRDNTVFRPLEKGLPTMLLADNLVDEARTAAASSSYHDMSDLLGEVSGGAASVVVPEGKRLVRRKKRESHLGAIADLADDLGLGDALANDEDLYEEVLEDITPPPSEPDVSETAVEAFPDLGELDMINSELGIVESPRASKPVALEPVEDTPTVGGSYRRTGSSSVRGARKVAEEAGSRLSQRMDSFFRAPQEPTTLNVVVEAERKAYKPKIENIKVSRKLNDSQLDALLDEIDPEVDTSHREPAEVEVPEPEKEEPVDDFDSLMDGLDRDLEEEPAKAAHHEEEPAKAAQPVQQDAPPDADMIDGLLDDLNENSLEDAQSDGSMEDLLADLETGDGVEAGPTAAEVEEAERAREKALAKQLASERVRRKAEEVVEFLGRLWVPEERRAQPEMANEFVRGVFQEAQAVAAQPSTEDGHKFAIVQACKELGRQTQACLQALNGLAQVGGSSGPAAKIMFEGYAEQRQRLARTFDELLYAMYLPDDVAPKSGIVPLPDQAAPGEEPATAGGPTRVEINAVCQPLRDCVLETMRGFFATAHVPGALDGPGGNLPPIDDDDDDSVPLSGKCERAVGLFKPLFALLKAGVADSPPDQVCTAAVAAIRSLVPISRAVNESRRRYGAKSPFTSAPDLRRLAQTMSNGVSSLFEPLVLSQRGISKARDELPDLSSKLADATVQVLLGLKSILQLAQQQQ